MTAETSDACDTSFAKSGMTSAPRKMLCDEMLNRFHRNPGLPEEDHRSLMEKLRTDREKFNEKLPPRLQKPAPDDAP